METKSNIKDYSYCKLYDLKLPVGFKLLRLDIPRTQYKLLKSVLFQIPEVSDKIDQSLLTVSVRARIKSPGHGLTNWIQQSSQNLSDHGCVWEEEWCFFELCFSELPIGAAIEFEVGASDGATDYGVIGAATLGLFGKHGSLKGGCYKLLLKPKSDARLGSCKANTPLDKAVWAFREEMGENDDLEWLNVKSFSAIVKLENEELEKLTDAVLHVTLPSFDFPVLYMEKLLNTPTNLCYIKPQAKTVLLQDPEIYLENYTELKHRRLVRGQRTGREMLDKELKPDARARDELQRLLKCPPTYRMSSEETDLVWKFRFYLTRDKRALTKFLKVVDWHDASETRMAIDMLHLWTNIDADDALELLGPEFGNPEIMSFGVSQLARASDSELALYLLQLVQALKFHQPRQLEKDPLAYLLLNRAIQSPHTLGHLLFWYFGVECEDVTVQNTYQPLYRMFLDGIKNSVNGKSFYEALQRQRRLVSTLTSLAVEALAMKEPRNKRIEWLKERLADPSLQLAKFQPLPMPVDPKVFVTGLIPEKASIFKSSLMPMHLTFERADGGEYSVIFKHGDDLRQDQFVIQIIVLMDRLLQQENLDLNLTPYRVLATSQQCGMIQFIPSQPLATILATCGGNLHNYLRRFHPDSAGPFGIHPLVMEAYIRSCAGYCVITYLLGIGDRHLDNLLLTQTGQLFHVDFGYILGRDPKHFAPPMKLCKEMVEAMGGQSSPHYAKFKSFCFSAFNILRKNANLILNLFNLMIKTTLPDIVLAPDQVVYKVQEKFRLDLSEEQAVVFFSQLINESVSALFPQVIDRIHSWAQYWRK